MHNFISDFLSYLNAEITSSNNTLDAYRRDLNKFNNYCLKYNIELLNITEQEIEKYIIDLNKICSTSSINRNISSLKHFYVFLLQEQFINKSPLVNIELLKKPQILPKFLSSLEIKQLLSVAEQNKDQDLRLYLMLELLYATGMRVSELVSLKKSVIKYEAQQILPYLIIIGKGNKERLVPIHQNAINLLQEYMPILYSKEIYLFPSDSEQGYITRQRFGQLLKDLANRTNIDPEKVSPHVIRHSFATHIMDNGADLKVIQEILGHSDISTTQIYTHLTTSKLKNTLVEYHPLSDEQK